VLLQRLFSFVSMTSHRSLCDSEPPSPRALQGSSQGLFHLLIVPLVHFFRETKGLSRATISLLVESWN
jgi:hypothetical protein